MKIAIIGGGASGLSCAIEAAEKAKRLKKPVEITVYESKDRVGKKILATGNGRCNMLNMNDKVCYFGDSDFAKAVTEKYSVKSNLQFFRRMGLYTRADEEGRVYPLSNQASGVLDILRFECERLGVKFVVDSEIRTIETKNDGFVLNKNHFANKVVLACGSAAGVKNFNGYSLLKNLGHTVTKINPSLTKLVVKDNTLLKPLKGVRQKATLKLFINGQFVTEEKGEVLFADYGLSGIAAMQLSAYIARHFIKNKTAPLVKIDLVPDFEKDALQKAVSEICNHNPEGKAENIFTGFMPKKIGEALLKECKIPFGKSCSLLSKKDIEALVTAAKGLSFEIISLKDFSEAQVVAGGALCSEFKKETLESKKQKNLFCCGELLDVDGLCGGYNLGWAWSSGRLCGNSLI